MFGPGAAVCEQLTTSVTSMIAAKALSSFQIPSVVIFPILRLRLFQPLGFHGFYCELLLASSTRYLSSRTDTYPGVLRLTLNSALVFVG